MVKVGGKRKKERRGEGKKKIKEMIRKTRLSQLGRNV